MRIDAPNGWLCAALFAAGIASGCKYPVELFCDEETRCTDPERPFCDLKGEFPASEGIGKTCIPDPFPGDAEASIHFPPGDCVADATEIRVRGTATHPAGVAAVRVGGVDALSSDDFATWEVDVPLVAGINELQIDVEGQNGDVDLGVEGLQIEVSTELLAEPSDLTLASSSLAYVLDRGAVFAVNLTTGNRTLVSGLGRGSGPDLDGLAITFDSQRDQILVGQVGSIIAVDPANGDRTEILSDLFVLPRGLAIDGDRVLVAAVISAPSIQAVDLETGEETIISSPMTGSGPSFSSLSALALDRGNNRVLVVDRGIDALYAVDLATGDRTIVSGEDVGSGTVFDVPVGVAVGTDGTTAWVTDTGLAAIVQIDLGSGNRSIISGMDVGGGASLACPHSIELAASGTFLVTEPCSPAVIEVHPETGDRTLVSSSRAGSGPALSAPTSVSAHAGSDQAIVLSLGRVFAVDVGTGTRTILADTQDLGGFAGAIVSDTSQDAAYVLVGTQLLRLPLDGGTFTVISGAETGAGPGFPVSTRQAMTIEETGRLFVAFDLSGVIFSVDLATGDRTIVADANTGTGPPLSALSSVVIDSENNRLLATDLGSDSLIGVDLQTGNRLILSDASRGAGPVFESPFGVDLGGGRAIVVDAGLDEMLSVDLTSGNRSIILEPGPNAPPMPSPRGVDVDPVRRVAFVVDRLVGILAVDLETGRRVLLSH